MWYGSNSGYIGRRMSVRAQEAYEDGEMPMSKWTKAAILEAIEEYAYSEDINLKGVDLQKLTRSELLDAFIEYKSWHHTGKYYNRTDFYGLKELEASDLTQEKVLEIINARPPKKKLTPEERA